MKVKTIRTLNHLLDKNSDYATFAVEAGLCGISKAEINKFLSSNVFLLKAKNVEVWVIRKKARFVYEATKARAMPVASALEFLRKLSKPLPGIE